MSRRPPNPAAERAAKNQQTIKSLLKLEANKVCADCKRNKHPRWASWNLGVFICIRCSGIHRGMGTHISRVKSVDLDAWTDEQLQSILSWGNARANKYWEAKLAAAHVPSEAKIENFIRTKYELKRWVMDGPMPDPSTLDVEEDDNIPLSIVKEKQNVERRESVRKASVGQTAAPRNIPAPQADLIGGDPILPRASTAGPVGTNFPPKAAPAPPKATSTKDSLLGLDFLGTEPAAPPRPASTTGTPGSSGQSRPDLKQSILSLYATAPRPQPQPSAASQTPSGAFGGIPSPTGMGQSQSSFNGLNDAFSSLSFTNQPVAPAASAATSPPHDAFSNLANISSHSSPKPNSSAFSGLSGGNFFDLKPAAAVGPVHQSRPSIGSPTSFGGFSSPVATAAAPKPSAQPSSAALGDLFDFSSSSPAPPPPKPVVSSPPFSGANSVFNLSPNQPKPSPAAPVAGAPLPAVTSTALSNLDVWGGSVWGAPEAKKSPEVPKPVSIGGTNDFGWGNPVTTSSLANQPIVPGATGGFAPKVSADEEFGGWTSSTGAPSGSASTKPAGSLGASEDLFSNVWQ